MTQRQVVNTGGIGAVDAALKAINGNFTELYGAIGGAISVEDAGIPQGTAGTLNFTGAGVTASVAGGLATIDVPSSGTGTDDPLRPAVVVAGRYYPPDTLDFGASTVSGGPDTIWLLPFSKKIVIDQLMCRVTTALAGANIRLGLYESDPTTGRPTNLIEGSGNIVAATTGLKTFTLSSPCTVERPVWLARLHSGALVMRRGVPQDSHQLLGFTDIDTVEGNSDTGWTVGHTFGALPSTISGANPAPVSGMVAARAA